MRKSPQEIGEILGKWIGIFLGVGIVVACIVAAVSDTLSFGDIVTWFMNTIGWWIIGAVVLVLVILLVIVGFLHLLPIIGFAAGILGLILLFKGQTIIGLVLLVVGIFVAFKIGGWDDGL